MTMGHLHDCGWLFVLMTINVSHMSIEKNTTYNSGVILQTEYPKLFFRNLE
jgi:hypothetical protein